MIRFFLILAFVFGSAQAANANICTIPTTLVNGTIVDASQLNGNFLSLQSCGNSVDSTNMGSSGIYASQIKPATVGQATFGGTIAYTFLTAPLMSGAGITAATIPNASLVTTPLTSVTGSGNIASSGGTTPNITLVNPPTISGANINANTIPNGALVTTPLTALTAGTNISITGSAPNLTISAAGGATGVTSVSGSGNIASSGGVTPNISITTNPNFSTAVTTPTVSYNGPQISNDQSGSPGLLFTIPSATPTFGYRFFANGTGQLLLTVATNTTASSVTVGAPSYYITGQVNNALDVVAGITVLHATSTSNTINLENGPANAYAAVNGGVYTNASDRRLKRDITPYTRGLDTIMELKPVHFVYRADSKKSMGFIAQDVQRVLPELVTSTKLKGKATLGVNYSGIIAPLVAAVQEQQREIVELRAEVKALRQAK